VAPAWRPWLGCLYDAGRVVADGGRWFAAEADRDPVALWRGRLEAVGPVFADAIDATAAAALARLESEGIAMRAALDGRPVVCHRRLLARIRRAMVERLRRAIQPVSQEDFAAFRRRWQHLEPDGRLDGPRGVAEALRQLAGLEFTAAAWEHEVLPARVRDYKREWLDHLTLTGEFVWLRLWGAYGGPLSTCGIAIVPQSDLDAWLALAAERRTPRELGAPAQQLRELLQQRGASFPGDLQARAKLLPSWFEDGLGELVASGLATCDSFAALRQLAIAPSRRRFPVHAVGRFALVPPAAAEVTLADGGTPHEMAARQLLARHGVACLAVVQEERFPVPWRLLLRALRAMELRGAVRGGRFVAGFSGEQFATEEAVAELRRRAPEAVEARARGGQDG
jgi:ATP-dependent Lhr-like helicase